MIIQICASVTFQSMVAVLMVDRMLCVTDVGSTTGAADGVAIAPLVEPEAATMLVAILLETLMDETPHIRHWPETITYGINSTTHT